MNTTIAEYSPGVLSLLPLFYVGWSDSVLSPSEMKLIHNKIGSFNFLTKEDKEYLIKYSDPRNPPPPEVFKEWLEAMRDAASNIPLGKKSNLTQLGYEMAQVAIGYKKEEVWRSPKVQKALLDIESQLGVNNYDGLNTMLLQLNKEGLEAKPISCSFDVEKMKDILDGKYADIKRKLKKLLRDPAFTYSYEVDKDVQRLNILNQVRMLSQQGIGAIGFDKKYGGEGKVGDYMAVFESLGYHDLSLMVKYGVQFGLFGGAVYSLGSEKHHKKYVKALANGDLLGCFAMTETGHGSNVKQLETTGTYDKATDEIIIHSPTYSAGKEYIGNALHGSLAVVFCQLRVDEVCNGIHAVLVPYRDDKGNTLAGIKVEDCGYKMGLNGVDNGRIWFDQVRVPRENLLDKYGGIGAGGVYESPIENENKRFFTMLGALVAGRICVGHAGLNAGKTGLTIAIKYALKRRQFGPDGHDETLIMDYPSHQQRLTPLLVKSYLYHFALSNLREEYIDTLHELDKRKVETKAAGLKAMATWLGTRAIQESREACGGKGYLAENRFAELKGDSDVFTTFEGDNTVLMQLVAKGLLTQFKQSFHDDGAKAVMRFIMGKISFTLTEYNPYFKRNTDLDHLMSDDFHADALRYREKKILISLSNRMRKYLKKRINPYDAFLKCQNHMLDLAEAYVDRLVYRETWKTLNTMESSPEKDVLIKMVRYYALDIMSTHKGWYLENDFMEGSKTKAIRRIINKLNQELRMELEGLVDAFDIPEESLRAEIVKG